MNAIVLLTEAIKPFVFSTLRTWIAALGGGLVALGVFNSPDQKTAFTGICLAVCMWLWSQIEKVETVGIKKELENLRAALSVVRAGGTLPMPTMPQPSLQPAVSNTGEDDMRVQQTSRAMDRIAMTLLVLMVLAIGAIQVYAADVSPGKTKAAAAAPTTSDCTPAQCKGFYLGGNIAGAGVSSQLNGLDTASLAAGGLVGIEAGWQFWNGTLFGGIDITMDYDATGTSGGRPGYFAAQMFRVGGAVSNLFTGLPVAAQGPMAQVANVSMIAPFFQVGPVESRIGLGWGVGAGTEWALGGPWMATLDGIHVTYDSTVNPALKVNTADVVRVGVHRKF